MSGDWQAAEHNVVQCWYEKSHSAEWNEDKRKSFFLFPWLTFILCGWWFYTVIWMPGKWLPLSRTLISASNYIPQHLSHSVAFNNSDLWKRNVSLDITHHVPLFLQQQGVDNLKRTVVLDFNMDWATESAKWFSWRGVITTMRALTEASDDWTLLSFPAANKSNTKKQQSTYRTGLHLSLTLCALY